MASLKYRATDLLHGLLTVSPVSLALAVSNPAKLRYYHANAWRIFHKSSRRRLPSITPAELLKFEGDVTLRFQRDGLYAFYEPDFRIVELIAMLEPKRMFEIGTLRGHKSALFAINSSQDAEVFTLDLPPGSIAEGITEKFRHGITATGVGEFFRDRELPGAKINQLFGDSRTFDYTPYYDSIDFIYVDGSHTYEFALSDTFNAFRMIRPGGVILWHDYESARSEYAVTGILERLRHVYNLPVYVLEGGDGDTRLGVMQVDATTKKNASRLPMPQPFSGAVVADSRTRSRSLPTRYRRKADSKSGSSIGRTPYDALNQRGSSASCPLPRPTSARTRNEWRTSGQLLSERNLSRAGTRFAGDQGSGTFFGLRVSRGAIVSGRK